ncbi:MAG TPA: tetratricopeptide repeat protein [Candidatus Koribacter sp.]|jgi:tetratricopeptide (TPR) repeat protein
MRNQLAVCLVSAALAIFPTTSAAQHEHHHGGTGTGAPPTYGDVHFQTSCSPDGQKGFELGVAELHSFEYETAASEFKKVTDAEPACAIAYWGQAMVLYHPLWNNPSKQDLADGWSLVQKGLQAKEITAREKQYLEALGTFYKPGETATQERAEGYSDGMEKLHAAYPQDEEAAVFYALSLLGSESPTDTTLSHSRKAVAILNEILAKDPNHPGVTHYIIHASDNPIMAPDALAAARQYAKIAPDSVHAVHMPSHIFARLGLWQESITSNVAAIEVAKKNGEAVEYQLHPMDFLMYAYLQTGQDDKAKQVEEQAIGMGNTGFGHGRENYYYYVQSHFPAMVDIETKDWKAAEALQPAEGAGPGMQEMTFWAQAVGSGHLKHVAAAKTAVANLEKAVAEDEKAHPVNGNRPVDTDLNEGKAWLAYAEGKYEDAFSLLKPVIERQAAVGKGEVDLPAREMYAEMLLDTNQPKEALEQYKLSLKSDPNRFNGLYGAGKAAEMEGDHDAAVQYYAELVKNCEGSQRSELAHAKEVIGGTAAGAK